MAAVTFTTRGNLVGGQPENIDDVTNCLDKLLAGVNAIESANIVDGSIATADLAAGAVTSAKIETQQAWQSLALTGITGNLSYYKNSLGIVQFRADAYALPGGLAINSVICTLPAGYRPGVDSWFRGHTTEAATIGSAWMLMIATTGVITTKQGLSGSQQPSFGSLQFRAEN